MTWAFLRNNDRNKNSKRRERKQKRGSRAHDRRKHRFEALEDRHMLATFTVLNNTDAGAGSLREAIDQANMLAGADVIQFDAAVSGQTITLTTGDLDITDTLDINGPGSTNLIIDAAGASRIFNITDGGGDVTIEGLSLINGNSGLGNSGGAIFSESFGLLNVSNSVITGSTAGLGSGGGIYAFADVMLTNVTLGGVGPLVNTAGAGGGGVFSLGNVTVQNSVVSGNSGGFGSGGGIYAFGMVTVENSTIGGSAVGEGNASLDSGGGIYARAISLQNSTISGNSTGVGDGGGLYASGLIVARNSTIADNEATAGNGGGIAGGNVTLQNATIALNTAPGGLGGGVSAINRFRINNSIVVGNTDGGANPDLDIPAGAFSRVRFSLIGDNTGLPAGAQFNVTGPAGPPNGSDNLIGMPGGVNAIPIATVLDAAGLQDNGGPTHTIALAAMSPALNRGSNNLTVNVSLGDQRGLPFVRIFGAAVDMGAFEDQPPAPANTDPTVVNPIVDQTAFVGVPFVFAVPINTFADADGDALTYTATLAGGGALPAWLTFNPASRTFIGVPTAADVGPITVRVTASDGNGGTVFDDFILTVISNPPPVVSNAIPDQSATVAVPYSFTFAANTFTDPNGEPLTYSAMLSGGGALPAWLSFNAATRTFSGTPGPGDVGAIMVRVTATDSAGGTAFDDFNLTVSTALFTEDFNDPMVDPRLVTQRGTFEVLANAYFGTRQAQGGKAIAIIDPLVLPAHYEVSTTVNLTPIGGGRFANGFIIFDYVNPNNFKYAGAFATLDRFVIGSVTNGVFNRLVQTPAVINPGVDINLRLDINGSVATLFNGATQVATRTFANAFTGKVGIGTNNANTSFDNLIVQPV